MLLWVTIRREEDREQNLRHQKRPAVIQKDTVHPLGTKNLTRVSVRNRGGKTLAFSHLNTGPQTPEVYAPQVLAAQTFLGHPATAGHL